MSEELNKELKAFQIEQLSLAEERTFLAIERSQLAYERTFLSWLRTGLGCVGGGIAFVRLLAFRSTGHQISAQVIGSVLILLGITIFIFSQLSYKKRIRLLGIEREEESSLPVVVCITFALVVISTFIWLLVLL